MDESVAKKLGIRRPTGPAADPSVSISTVKANIATRSRNPIEAHAEKREHRHLGLIFVPILLLVAFLVGLLAGLGMNASEVEKSLKDCLGDFAGDAFHRTIVWERDFLQ